MNQTLCIFGRLPSLSLAELESLYGADKLQAVGDHAALLDIEPAQVDFSRLGGTVKFCKVLTVLDTTNWKEIEKFLRGVVPQHVGSLPEGKMKLGLSAYGLKISVGQINASGLELKKVIKSTGKSVRVVPNKELTLSSAQVLHNQLTGHLGWELIFVKDGSKTIVAQNIAEQDIESYSARDQARPKRDARVGMLPPKLAQTIVNLAAGYIGDQPVAESCEPGSQPKKNQTVLDPFCGTGVILQEAALMGYDVYGTDLEQRMVDYTKSNLDWLGERFAHAPFSYYLDQADATNYSWDNHFNFIASEAYLGRPFSAAPGPEVLSEVMSDVNLIIKKFLQNLSSQTGPGFRLCLAVPAWLVNYDGSHASRLSGAQGASEQRNEPYKKYGERVAQHATQRSAKSTQGVSSPAGKQLSAPRYVWHLPLIDQISNLGYNRVSFKLVDNADLIYFREDQTVARELLVLTRK